MKFLFTLSMMLSVLIGSAQIEFTISNAKGEPVSHATVILTKGAANTLVKSSISDESGKVSFENIAEGEYQVKITAGNFEPFTKTIQVNGQALIPVSLAPLEAAKLSEVTVTAKKPFIQKMHDRIVVNVDNSIVNAGSSAFEVLERSPGITIDPNDVIALRGKQGVIVMVDGKPSPMSGADLVNYLRGLPSNAIERIDIITNPSSKYDAAGNSGIIDIRMKKDKRIGTNGTLTTGYGQGVYPKANAGGSINHRNKKLNAFASYNYSYRKNLNHLFLDRNFFTNGTFNGADFKDNRSTAPFNSHSVRSGMDFFPSTKTIIGFVVSGSFNHWTRNNNNNSFVFDQNYQPDFTFQTNARNKDRARNVVGNINFKHSFNTKGREITADVDHGRYDSRSVSRTATSYYKLSGGSSQPDYILDGNQKGNLTLTTARVDYVNPLKNKSSLEFGAKTSFVSSDNDAKFFDASTGIPQNDATKTNHFLYDENNNAAYINFKKDFKKFDMQLGLRAEQTNIKTYQVMGDQKWDSSYLQLFPTAFFNYRIAEEKVLGVSVSRRIDRPGYSQLNPFLFLIDVTTYSTGNPGLLPQFTWAYELNYTVKNLSFALNYSHTKNNQNIVIARFSDVFPNIPQDDNVTVQIPVNISSSDYAGLSISAPVKIRKWWNMVNNADVFYNHYNGSLGGTKLDNGKPSVNVRTNNTFTFKKGWTTEISANFNSGEQYGFMVTDPQWGVAAGVQKTVLKNKGTIRLNVTDIFWTNLPKAVITYDNYIEKWNAKRETRVVNIGFTYRFGKNTVQGARKRTTGSEEERRRAGG